MRGCNRGICGASRPEDSHKSRTHKLQHIARRLIEEGVPTPSGKTKWQASTIRSMLSNEKYMGDALLQKQFTVDFLQKKKKVNVGEVPQYYVENSHPAIIPRELFMRVQAEIKRRQQLGHSYNGKSVFSARIVCGDCGAFYGSKVWNSTNQFRRVVWQCNAPLSIVFLFSNACCLFIKSPQKN